MAWAGVDGQRDTSPPSAARCKDIARTPVTNCEPQCVTLAGYRYGLRHGMKVQFVTAYRFSHLQSYGVMARGNVTSVYPTLERGYTRDWLPAYSFVVRARAMVLTGERSLSDTSGARQYCPRARQTAPDNYVYWLSSALKNRLQRAHQRTDWDAKLRHSPGMPAAETHKLVYETPNYVISHAAARLYYSTTVNYRDSSVRGYHDKTVLPYGVSPCPCS
jgi:hypothetical protein